MTNWNDITVTAPELASKVRARFEATGLGYLATLRPNGFPRISGLEPLFAEGELWLGMMPDSLKAKDLRRDPRFALQSANTDKQVAGGDARITAMAVETAPDELERFRKLFAAANGVEPPPGSFHLFRADIVELTFLMPAGDHLVIESMRAGGLPKRVERR